MRNKIETKALILLKLAYEIRQFKFADAKVADAFPRLLYFIYKGSGKEAVAAEEAQVSESIKWMDLSGNKGAEQ